MKKKLTGTSEEELTVKRSDFSLLSDATSYSALVSSSEEFVQSSPESATHAEKKTFQF